jgi:hypothetical protein
MFCMLLKPQRFGTSFHFDHEVKGQEPNLFHPLVQVSDYLDDGAQQVRFLSFHLMKEVETTSEKGAHACIHTYTADVRTKAFTHTHKCIHTRARMPNSGKPSTINVTHPRKPKSYSELQPREPKLYSELQSREPKLYSELQPREPKDQNQPAEL